MLDSVDVDSDTGRYIAKYSDGELVLNSSGPWLEKGKLRATNITVTNFSYPQDPPIVGELDFYLIFFGKFDDVDLWFLVEAAWQGTPEVKFDDFGNPVFQRGTEDLEAAIIIADYDLSCGHIIGYWGEQEWSNVLNAEDDDWNTFSGVGIPNKWLYVNHPYFGDGERWWRFKF